ncbi:ubiquitin carboxyl-terminal hydrolase 13 [Limosa lapponica baueri]|uniref:Ubiquitin carboxyl-terminal hydrolase n=1 Tax=Limosa lapponica baueri TaxID=1758121 RepID=A0A2I0TML7_LIMLA|nr:ubiquitin carboxyl-terminal hydrolase 13 [Limosa lapponica baueri]
MPEPGLQAKQSRQSGRHKTSPQTDVPFQISYHGSICQCSKSSDEKGLFLVAAEKEVMLLEVTDSGCCHPSGLAGAADLETNSDLNSDDFEYEDEAKLVIFPDHYEIPLPNIEELPALVNVYSFDEEEPVLDPHIAKHLAHFGIDMLQMQVAENGLRDNDIKPRVSEWEVIQEAGVKLKPMYGPGYTGMKNLGNSCYLNAVMQAIFSIPEFQRAYVGNLPRIFDYSPLDPTQDFNTQMAKLGHGLLSGQYSKPPMKSELIEQVMKEEHKRNPVGSENPSDVFRFLVEERTQCCQSRKVRYAERVDYIMQLPVAMEAATNKDVSIDMPDFLDISHLRARGLQPGEEELPDIAPPIIIPDDPKALDIDDSSVMQLAEMGFPLEACRKAVYYTGNLGAEVAFNWIIAHMEDPAPAECLLNTVFHGGRNNNLERALEWIFSHPELEEESEPALDTMNMANNTNANVLAETGSEGPRIKDGSGRYELFGFISHMGTSTMSGHYVCHLKKEGRWVIYNDLRVCASERPPKDLGYIYFYHRIPS